MPPVTCMFEDTQKFTVTQPAVQVQHQVVIDEGAVDYEPNHCQQIE